MKKHLAALCNALGEQKGHLAALEGLSRVITGSALKTDIERMQQATGQVQVRTQALHKVEEQRMAAADELCRLLGMQAGAPLSALIERIREDAPQEAAQLTQLLADIQTLIHSLGKTGDENQKLIHSQLDWIDFQLNLLTDPGTQGAVYGSGGTEQQAPMPRLNLLDKKA